MSERDKKREKNRRRRQKKNEKFDRTGKGSRIPKKGETVIFQKTLRNKTSLATRNALQKLTLFYTRFEEEEEEEEEEKKRVVSVMNASEERALKRVERLKTHVVQQQQRGNCIERRETSASFFSSWVRGRFLSAKIGRRRKGGKASFSSSSSSSSSNLLPSLPRSSTRSH